MRRFPKDWQGMNWIRQTLRLAIYLRDEFTCAYCAFDMHDAAPGTLTLDHIVPRSEGGSNEAINLVTACMECNIRKNGTPLRKFTSSANVKTIRARCKRPLNMALAKAIIAGTAVRPTPVPF